MTYGIAGLEQAILDLAVDALDDAGRLVPASDRVQRYHGDPPVECCDGNGALYVFWRPATFDRTGLAANIYNPPGRPVVDLWLRLFRCFPALGDDGSAPVGTDDAANGLAVDADVLFAAFMDAICAQTLAPYLQGCDNFGLLDMNPRPPRGGCAGVELHFRAGWRRWNPGT